MEFLLDPSMFSCFLLGLCGYRERVRWALLCILGLWYICLYAICEAASHLPFVSSSRSLLDHPQRTPAATMGDSGSESGDEAGGDRALRQTSAGQDELAGLVIGDQVHIPRRMAPFARALVTVYELARFSDREFDQEEYAKYMHLLISLIHRYVCAKGKDPNGKLSGRFTIVQFYFSHFGTS